MKSEVDLVIVGGGAAGFAAAVAATEAGAQVILLEKLERAGGSSAMSGGCLAFAGTPLQASRGVEDSAALLLQDLLEVGKRENDEALARAYADHQLDTYHWLVDRGVIFSPALEAASGQSVPRVHTVDPADMVRQLHARAAATGRLSYFADTAAQSLVRGSDGVVGGVVDTIGRCFIGRRVLLASGGFAKDPAQIHAFAPQYREAVFVAGAGSTGDGMRMARKLGADLRDMAYIKGTFGKHPTDETNDHSLQGVYKGAIAVNQDGRRYVDESLSYKLLGDACMAQPWHTTYQILDQDIFDQGDDRVRIFDFGRRLEEGLFVVADTLAELAVQLEIPVDRLTETVARYNGFVDAGEDLDFGRQHLVHQFGALRRIARAPFYAYPSTAVVFGTYCGLRVDSAGRVIDVDGDVIKGLYAAGEVIGGFHGAAYMTGSALGKAVVFGRLIGAAAAGK
jgi:fumarate reductase flavoprotein subunit